MKRIETLAILGAMLLLAGVNSAAVAQGGSAPAAQRGTVNMLFYPIPYQDGWHGIHSHDYTHYDHVPPQPGAYEHTPQRSHYPYLHAPLYPSPQPWVPAKVGGTVVTNQAFAPHELLYPHSYKSLYGPFSYQVSGDWIVTPLGVWSTEHWELQGTEVNVKYKSRIPLTALFLPPFAP